eukprot:176300-Rhodomonas_salina.2
MSDPGPRRVASGTRVPRHVAGGHSSGSGALGPGSIGRAVPRGPGWFGIGLVHAAPHLGPGLPRRSTRAATATETPRRRHCLRHGYPGRSADAVPTPPRATLSPTEEPQSLAATLAPLRFRSASHSAPTILTLLKGSTVCDEPSLRDMLDEELRFSDPVIQSFARNLLGWEDNWGGSMSRDLRVFREVLCAQLTDAMAREVANHELQGVRRTEAGDGTGTSGGGAAGGSGGAGGSPMPISPIPPPAQTPTGPGAP